MNDTPIILIIDDNPTNLSVLFEYLEESGYELAVAQSGEEALQQLRHAEKGSGRHTPVIALTAHALRGDEERLRAAGFDGYLSKPLNMQALLQELERVTGPAR